MKTRSSQPKSNTKQHFQQSTVPKTSLFQCCENEQKQKEFGVVQKINQQKDLGKTSQSQQKEEVLTKQTNRVQRNLQVTQFKIKLKQFVTNVLDNQTMSHIQEFLKIKGLQKQIPIQKLKSASLCEDFQYFKFLKNNEQKILNVPILQLFIKFNEKLDKSLCRKRCLNRIKRILPILTKQRIIQSIQLNKTFQINHVRNRINKFIGQVVDQNVQKLLKKYIQENQKSQNQNYQKSKYKKHFTLVENCKILLIMKEKSQKSLCLISQIQKYIKNRSISSIYSRLYIMQKLLTKQKLIFHIQNGFNLRKTKKNYQTQALIKWIKTQINGVILEQIQEISQKLTLKHQQFRIFKMIDDIIICLFIKKYYGETAIANICTLIGQKIEKTQQQIQSRFKLIKQKHLKFQYLKKLNFEVTQKLHKVKWNLSEKQCINQEQIQNLVKLEGVYLEADIQQVETDSEPVLQNFIAANCFDKENTSQIDTIIDKLNESRFHQNSIIDILKELETSIFSQSSYQQQSKSFLAKIEQNDFHKTDRFNDETVFQQDYSKKQSKKVKKQLKNGYQEGNLSNYAKGYVEVKTAQGSSKNIQMKLEEDEIKATHNPQKGRNSDNKVQ